MRDKIKCIVDAIIKLEEEVEHAYKCGNVDLVFIKGHLIGSRHELEDAIQHLAMEPIQND